jgi:beta-mannosidase
MVSCLLVLLLLLAFQAQRGPHAAAADAVHVSPSSSPRLRDPTILGDLSKRSAVYLDGDMWTAHSCGGNGAPVAVPSTVPGDLVSDLARAGVIGDPVFDVNWRDQSGVWAREGGWSFTRAFDYSRSASSSSVLLVLDGVKMAADVYLNGVRVSKDGLADQHLRYEFPVTSVLRPTANNITIHIPLPSNDKRNDEGRYAACSGGWDWALYSNTFTPGGLPWLSMGVWKSVYLVELAELSLRAMVPHVFYNGPYPKEPLTDATASGWTVNVTAHVVAGPKGAPAGSGAFTVAIAGLDVPATTVSLPTALAPNAESKVTLSLNVAAGSVRLWWPNGAHASRGAEQPLYTISLSYRAKKLGVGLADEPVFVASKKIGFRTLAVVTDDDTNPARLATLSGSGTLTLRYIVNGASLWARGSNVIPLDEFAGRADAEALALHLKSAAAAGMNMLLIWGGGIFQYTAFYEEADKLGLLLYHDLMYSAQFQSTHLCTATEMQRREIVYNIRRLSNHPSIAVWAGGNEIGGSDVFAKFALNVVRGEDQSRPLWPASPSTGWASGVDRLWGLPKIQEPLRAKLNVSKALGEDPRVQDDTFYMGFAEGFMNSKSNLPVPNITACGALCEKTSGCVVARYTPGACTPLGFGFPVAAWGVGPWMQSVWPPSTPVPVRAAPSVCKVETHGPYTGGRGWPAINSGNTTSSATFDPLKPPPLTPLHPSAMGTAQPGLFKSEFGVTAFSSFESISATLDPKDWGVHSKPMYWRSYSQDDIVDSYFGLNKAVNFSIIGDPAVFARQLLLSQLAAALLVKSRIETFRSENNFGTLTWQLGEIFPTGGWGSLEYAHSRTATKGQVRGGRWKPLHYWFESTLFKDIFVACGKMGECYVRNDSPFAALQGGHVIAELVSVVTGKRKGAQMVWPVSLPAGPGAVSWFCAAEGGKMPNCPIWSDVLSVAGCAKDASDCILNLTVVNSKGQGLVSNPSLLAAPVVILPRLLPVLLTATVGERQVPTSGNLNPSIRVTVTATAPALFVTLSTLAQGRFSRNAFFTAGGMETVEFYPIATEGDQYSNLKASLKVQSVNYKSSL